MWMFWMAAAWAASPEWTTVRASVGGGPSNRFGAARAGVEADVWLRPQLAVGGRVLAGINGGFGDEVHLWGVEPLVTVSTDGRVRPVAQAGIGLASERVRRIPLCLLGCVDDTVSTGPWEPVLTGSLAVGVASRRSGTTALLRLEADTGGNVACIPTIQFGAAFPIHDDR